MDPANSTKQFQRKGRNHKASTSLCWSSLLSDSQTMRSTLKERLSLLPEIAYQHVFRASSKGSEASYLDFSVLSVAVTTLGLILLVQLIRHRLDRNATGRPFFKTVLEGVYRECKFLDRCYLLHFGLLVTVQISKCFRTHPFLFLRISGNTWNCRVRHLPVA